jgi:hypothetical protein
MNDFEQGEGQCPSPCDVDCDADCHEWHQVPFKREHNPEMCPGNIKE